MKNETGRSMVEMLGVLAIIGVLSVGGIAGYTMAMNKYRANEILNAISMMSTVAHARNAGEGLTSSDGCKSLSDFGIDLTIGAGATSANIAIKSTGAGDSVYTVYVGTSVDATVFKNIKNAAPTSGTNAGWQLNSTQAACS